MKKSTIALATAALLGAAPAAAQEAKPSTTVQMSGNIAPYGVAKDTMLVEDFSTLITYQHDGLKVKLYQQDNWSGNFGGNKDFTALDVFITKNGLTLNPGVRVVNDHGTITKSGSLMAIKDLDGTKLSAIGVFGDTSLLAAGYLQGKTLDAAVQFTHDRGTGADTWYYSGGIHTNDAGIWLSQNGDKDRGITVTLDKEVGGILYAKRKADGNVFGATQFAIGNTPGTNSYFGVGTGQFASWLLADQLPRPKFRDFASYLANKGSVVGQVAFNKDADGTYVEAQMGKVLHTSEYGTVIAAGAGARYFEMPSGVKKLLPAGEAFVSVPVGKLKVDATGRFEQKPQGGLATTISLAGKYKF